MSGPKRLDEILANVIHQRGYGLDLSVVEFEEAWGKVVGERLAQLSVPTRLRKGVLEIKVANSTLMQELTFQKPQLLKSMVDQLSDHRIVDLRFRVGKI